MNLKFSNFDILSKVKLHTEENLYHDKNHYLRTKKEPTVQFTVPCTGQDEETRIIKENSVYTRNIYSLHKTRILLTKWPNDFKHQFHNSIFP